MRSLLTLHRKHLLARDNPLPLSWPKSQPFATKLPTLRSLILYGLTDSYYPPPEGQLRLDLIEQRPSCPPLQSLTFLSLMISIKFSILRISQSLKDLSKQGFHPLPCSELPQTFMTFASLDLATMQILGNRSQRGFWSFL